MFSLKLLLQFSPYNPNPVGKGLHTTCNTAEVFNGGRFHPLPYSTKVVHQLVHNRNKDNIALSDHCPQAVLFCFLFFLLNFQYGVHPGLVAS